MVQLHQLTSVRLPASAATRLGPNLDDLVQKRSIAKLSVSPTIKDSTAIFFNEKLSGIPEPID